MQQYQPKQTQIYYGDRGLKFVDFIKRGLRKGSLKEKYINVLTSEDSMKTYSIAFTHESANPDQNYEFLEKIGDTMANSCIVWYLSRRFPQISCPKGVPILAELVKTNISKKSFGEISEKMGSWEFITASMEDRNKKRKDLLEDVFEAFIGATCKLIDEKIKMGAGYAICYNIIKGVFDDISISIDYEKIVDPITRLKNWHDLEENKEKFGRGMEYTHKKVIISENKSLSETEITLTKLDKATGRSRTFVIGKGTSSLKKYSEQVAAADAINNLKKQGAEFIIPAVYINLC